FEDARLIARSSENRKVMTPTTRSRIAATVMSTALRWRWYHSGKRLGMSAPRGDGRQRGPKHHPCHAPDASRCATYDMRWLKSGKSGPRDVLGAGEGCGRRMDAAPWWSVPWICVLHSSLFWS